MTEPVPDTSGDLEQWLVTRGAAVLLVDAGGVLFNNVVEESTFIAEVAAACHVSAAPLLSAYSAADHVFETNEASVHDVIAACVHRLGGRIPDGSDFQRIDHLYTASVVMNTRMFAALAAVRRRGVTLVLANNEAEHWDRLKHRRFAHFDLFDHHASSWRLGACKPTTAYFEAVDRLLAPRGRSEWHLLDDTAGVVARARALNVPATLVTRAAWNWEAASVRDPHL